MIARIKIVYRYLTVTPKMSKQSTKNEKTKKTNSTENNTSGPVALDKAGNVSIKIQAKPGAKCNNITNISEDTVGIAISAPATEGEANAELIKYLASIFGVKKSFVSLDRGSRSRQKTVIVSGITIDQVLEKLRGEMEN